MSPFSFAVNLLVTDVSKVRVCVVQCGKSVLSFKLFVEADSTDLDKSSKTETPGNNMLILILMHSSLFRLLFKGFMHFWDSYVNLLLAILRQTEIWPCIWTIKSGTVIARQGQPNAEERPIEYPKIS